jgi:23S rRNA (pseudouridine1915-N3)-methyltransferase
MHLRLLAVGDRQPGWVDAAVDSYVSRLPREWKFRVEVLPAAKRSRKDPGRAVDEEAMALLGRLSTAEQVILLDERGRQLTSPELATRISAWQGMGRDLCFIIGGPDGVAAAIRERAQFCWSLSALTLPHGLARVTAVEQLYRAWSLNAGHPYHRS